MSDIHDMPAPEDYQPGFPGQDKFYKPSSSPLIGEDGHIFVTLEFIPVKERLPEDGSEVFVIANSYICDAWFSHNGPVPYWETDDKPVFNVSHWAERPKTKLAS